MDKDRILRQFNWRFLLVRIVVNAFALAGTAAFIPQIYFVEHTLSNWLFMALMLGVLNALLKPVLQFLTLQFIFVTYGLVVIAINTLLLWSLSFLFPSRFAVESILWLLIGGVVLGLLSSFLESLLGLTMPVLPDKPPELRLDVEEKARQVEWVSGAARRDAPLEPALAETPLSSGIYAAATVESEAGVADSSPTEGGGAAFEVDGTAQAETTDPEEQASLVEPDEDQEEERS
jgi:putative membrane protein